MTHDQDDPAYMARLNHFIAMLTDEDPSNRWKAAEVLARLQDERSVDPLIQALSDDD
jgi:HEAT repeat protein